jgi:hypothetical protein
MGYANKSGALAVAGVALLAIILNPSHDLLPRLAYWLTGLLSVTVTLVSWTVHPLFVGSAQMRLTDLLSPVATGITEYLLFGILIWIPDYPNLWQWFPFVVAAQAFVSWVLVVNRMTLLWKREDFATELAIIERMMRRSMVGSFIATSVTTVVYTALGVCTYFIVTRPHADNEVYLVVFCVFGFSLLLLILFSIATFKFLRKAEQIVAEE